MLKRSRHDDEMVNNTVEERGAKRQWQPSTGRGANAMWNNPMYQCQQQNAALQASVQGLHQTIRQLEERLRMVEVTIRQEERARCDQMLRQRIAAEVRRILNQPQAQQNMEFRRLHNRLLLKQ